MAEEWDGLRHIQSVTALLPTNLQAVASSREKLQLPRAPLICGMGESGHLMLPDRVEVNNSSRSHEES